MVDPDAACRACSHPGRGCETCADQPERSGGCCGARLRGDPCEACPEVGRPAPGWVALPLAAAVVAVELALGWGVLIGAPMVFG